LDRLREMRLNNGEIQEQLAKLCGVAPTTYARWESGYRQPDIKSLCILADHFGVSVDYLIGRDIDTKGLTREEKRLITGYRNLDAKNKHVLLTLLKLLLE